MKLRNITRMVAIIAMAGSLAGCVVYDPFPGPYYGGGGYYPAPPVYGSVGVTIAPGYGGYGGYRGYGGPRYGGWNRRYWR